MKKIYKILFTILILLALSLGGLLYSYQSSIQPLTKTSHEITIQIPENTLPSTVLSNLEEQGVIKSAFFAKILMKQENLSNIKAGIYVVDSSWSVKEILQYINVATNAITDEVLLTIPEGYWA
ncbi:MAG: endolytic transglycosylase MltG, partial [Traorella sp.]